MWRVNELYVTELCMNICLASSLASWTQPRSVNCNTWSVIVPMPIVIIIPIQCEPKNVQSNVTVLLLIFFQIMQIVDVIFILFCLPVLLTAMIEIWGWNSFCKSLNNRQSDFKIKSHVIFARYIFDTKGLGLLAF